MIMSLRLIHTRTRRETRELWDAACDESRTMQQRRKSYRLFRQRAGMLPSGSSLADINISQFQLEKLEAVLEMDPAGTERRHRAAVGFLGLALLLACIFGLAWSTNE